jgi:hypothetical protein
MATTTNTIITGVQNNQEFSVSRVIDRDVIIGVSPDPDNVEQLSLDSPPRVVITGVTDPAIAMPNVNVTVTMSGLDINVNVAGTYGIEPFNSLISYFTTGESNLYPGAGEATSFVDIVGKNRTIYKWVPDYTPVTISFEVFFHTYMSDDDPNTTAEESLTFTQLVTPNWDVALPIFLANINAQ